MTKKAKKASKDEELDPSLGAFLGSLIDFVEKLGELADKSVEL